MLGREVEDRFLKTEDDVTMCVEVVECTLTVPAKTLQKSELCDGELNWRAGGGEMEIFVQWVDALHSLG